MKGYLEMGNVSFQPILDTIYTKKQSNKFIHLIDDFIASLYKSGSAEKKLHATFSLENTEAIRDLLSKEKISLDNKDACKDFFVDLRQSVMQVPVIDLTVALELTLIQVQKLSEWVDNNTSEKYFLNIMVDPRIIGGALIGVKGFYKDKSLKKRLTDREITV
jgi:hypothetical protein